MKSFSSICIFTFLLSFVNEAFRPANSTAIAFYSNEENRTRSYSLNRLSINLGWAIGSAIGGVLAKYNYGLLFWVDGFTNIGAAFLMMFFLKPVNYKPAPVKKDAFTRQQSALRDKTYMWFIVLVSLFAVCFFQLFSNLSIYYRSVLHFSEPYIGLLMSVNGILIVMVEMLVVYKLEGKQKGTYYIVVGTFLMTAAYLMFNLVNMTHMLALVMTVVITFAEILAMPFMNSYWIGRSKLHNRGQYAALYTMAWSAAQTLGPFAAAQIAELYGFNVLWWAVAALSLLTACAFIWLHNRNAHIPIGS